VTFFDPLRIIGPPTRARGAAFTPTIFFGGNGDIDPHQRPGVGAHITIKAHNRDFFARCCQRHGNLNNP
jgi:hypothetical protein